MTVGPLCCGDSHRLSVAAYFDRGWRRQRSTPLPLAGERVVGCGGLGARMSLLVENGKVAGAHFEASTCVPLVAYCELLAEAIEGKPVEDLLDLSGSAIVDRLSEVPPGKRDRAFLATASLRSVVLKALTGAALPALSEEAREA